MATATTGPETLQALRTHRPDVSVIDVGYLLKESVFNAEDFIDALDRVAGGGTAGDPAVIARLLSSGPSTQRLERLTEREPVFAKLGLAGDDGHNRRVLAVLTYLNEP